MKVWTVTDAVRVARIVSASAVPVWLVCLVIAGLVGRVGGIENEAITAWSERWVGIPLAPIWNIRVSDVKAVLDPDT